MILVQGQPHRHTLRLLEPCSFSIHMPEKLVFRVSLSRLRFLRGMVQPQNFGAVGESGIAHILEQRVIWASRPVSLIFDYYGGFTTPAFITRPSSPLNSCIPHRGWPCLKRQTHAPRSQTVTGIVGLGSNACQTRNSKKLLQMRLRRRSTSVRLLLEIAGTVGDPRRWRSRRPRSCCR
jgi:hypothetical protein